MMTAWEWIRFLVGAGLIVFGLFILFTAVYGNYRFRFVLNRMQSASLGDTLGMLFTLLGAIVLSGFTVFSLKMLLVIVFFWITSPAASHLLVHMEVSTFNKVRKEDEEGGAK